MGLGIRVFLVNDDDSVKPLSFARLNRLMSGDRKERLPELANRRVRCAMVLLETANRRPIGVRHLDCMILAFDKAGRLDQRVRRQQGRDSAALFDAYFQQETSRYRARMSEAAPNVLQAAHRFEKKKYDQRYRWSPTKEILQSIGAAIFGSGI